MRPPSAGARAGRIFVRTSSDSQIANPAHEHDPKGRGEETENGGDHKVSRRHHRHGLGKDANGSRSDCFCDKVSEERGDSDGGEADYRVTADYELEGIERSGEWSSKGTGYCAGSTTSDKNAQITAAQAKSLAEPRGNTTCQLCVSRFETH